MEADRSVMALYRELLSVAALVLLRRMWGLWDAYWLLQSAERCVLSAVTGQAVGNRIAGCSPGRIIHTVWQCMS